MKRARLEPIHELAHDAERSTAARVAGMERRLQEAERREQELLRYRQEYQDALVARATTGLQVRSMREYQGFLARLGGALEAQRNLLIQLRRDCETERKALRVAIVRRQALGKVIEKARVESRKSDDRSQQRELDDTASRIVGAAL
jgi:flagellar FliJ protein